MSMDKWLKEIVSKREKKETTLEQDVRRICYHLSSTEPFKSLTNIDFIVSIIRTFFGIPKTKKRRRRK